MDDHTLTLLEFAELLEVAAGYALTLPGATWCLELRPELEPEAARASYALIDEARELLKAEGTPPFTELQDISGIISRLGIEGLVLRPLELRAILDVVRASRLVKNFVLSRPASGPGLTALCGELPVLGELEGALDRSIGPEGEVLDTASADLARIRQELSGLRGAIQTKLTGLMRTDRFRDALQDELITRRGGRYVIPVRIGARREVPGLVHDYSKSGATAFVEPLEMVEDNNRLNFLRRREKQEVDRILTRLSAQCASGLEAIGLASELLARVDGYLALATFSRAQRAVAPILDEETGIDLRQARHPLLEARRTAAGDRDRPVIPVDIRLEPARRTLVVSGINAGGKTVTLKTLGLLVLMAKAGMHIPVAEGSRLPCFDQVLAAMGDEQSLEADLSTFSGHVRRLIHLLNLADNRTLILLDELGGGTDPTEGAALALAVLDELSSRAAWVLAATHYHLLKTWAHLSDRAANASVRTDPGGRPVFGLDYGAPGYSAGLATARKMGLAPELVARAEGYLEEGQKKTLELIERLEKERAELSASRVESQALTEELALARARAGIAEKRRADIFEAELKAWRAKVDQAVRQAEAELKDLKRRIKAQSAAIEASLAEARTAGPLANPAPRALPALAQEIGRIKAQVRQALPAPRHRGQLTEVRPGDRVEVLSLGRSGQVKAVDSIRKKAEIDLDGMKVHAPWNDLARPGPGDRERRARQVTWTTFGLARNELNVVGMTVDEALPAVEKTLDQAVLGGIKSLTIIHGLGTGRLREAVRAFLREEPRVKGFQRAEPRSGGEGVTMVELE